MAAVRKRASSSGVMFMVPPQAADSGRGCRARCLLVRAERGADDVVGKVVSVTQHDGCAFGGRKDARQVLELQERVAVQLDGRLADVLEAERLSPAQLVHSDVRRDGEHPRTQMLAVLKTFVRAKRTHERLLPRVL